MSQLRQLKRIAAPGLKVDRLHEMRVMEQPLQPFVRLRGVRSRIARHVWASAHSMCVSRSRNSRRSRDRVLVLPRLHRTLRAGVFSRIAFQLSTTRRSSLYGFS